jgi:hypothetical protein
MDQMIFAGNLAVQESNSGMKQYYWEIYCLMGDPSTMVYFSVPPALAVDYMPLLPLGTPAFNVQTEPYAYVAISKNNILHGVAEADENGLAIVSLLPFTEPGFASIVITKQNRQPYIDSVMVASPQGPYLVLDSYTITDNGGNNNQVPEFAEPLTVDLSYLNFGNSDAVNAVSTLSTNDAFVTIPTPAHTWPLIASNGSATAPNAFTIQVNDYIPDMHNATFTITTQADTNIFTSGFSVLVYAPKLVNGVITFDDATSGNGNGQIDPGETIHVAMPTANTGHCSSSEVTAQLFVFGNTVTSNSPVVSLGALAPGATGNSDFTFTVSPDALPGSTFSMYITATAGAYNSISSLNPGVGAQVENFETGNFLKYNWHMKGAKPWKISATTKYEGLYGAVSGGINNAQQSEMYIDGQVLANDTISFFRKTSTENGYDFLKFYMDGIELGSWSGEKDWAKVSYPISAGNHRFSWVYEKDEATMGGQDAVWVDYIQFPPFSPTLTGALTVNAMAVPSTICAGNQSQLYIFATGGTGVYSYSWTPPSTLSNGGIFNPIASPSVTTTYNVLVTSTFFNTNTNITVNVEQAPATPVVSIANDHLVSSATEGNQWYNSQGMIQGATAQTYFPVQTETYYVIASSNAGCQSVASNGVVFGFTANKPTVENDFSVYPNPFTGRLNIDYTVQSAGQIKIIMYNSLGNEVGIVEEGFKASGDQRVVFDGSRLPAGMYYCKIFTGDSVQLAKVVKQ